MPTLVQKASNKSTSVGSTFAASFTTASTAGNLLVAFFTTISGSGSPSVTTPSGFSALTAVTHSASNDHFYGNVFYRYNAPATTTISVGTPAYEDACTLVIAEFSGCVSASDPKDASGGAYFVSGTSASQSVTMTNSGDLLCGFLGSDEATTSNGTLTVSASGYTLIAASEEVGYEGTFALYRVATGGGLQTFSATWTGGSVPGGIILVGFTSAGGGTLTGQVTLGSTLGGIASPVGALITQGAATLGSTLGGIASPIGVQTNAGVATLGQTTGGLQVTGALAPIFGRATLGQTTGGIAAVGVQSQVGTATLGQTTGGLVARASTGLPNFDIKHSLGRRYARWRPNNT